MAVDGPDNSDKSAKAEQKPKTQIIYQFSDGTQLNITDLKPTISRRLIEKHKAEIKAAATKSHLEKKTKTQKPTAQKVEAETKKEVVASSPNSVTLQVKKDTAVPTKVEPDKSATKPALQNSKLSTTPTTSKEIKITNLSVAELPTYPDVTKYTVPPGRTAENHPVTLFGITASIKKSLPKTKEEFDQIPKEKKFLSWDQVELLNKTPALLVARALDSSLIKLKMMPPHQELDPKEPPAGLVVDLRSFYSSLTPSRIEEIRGSEGTGTSQKENKLHDYLSASEVWGLAISSASSLERYYFKQIQAAKNSSKPKLTKIAGLERLSEYTSDLATNLYHLSRIESSWDRLAGSHKGAQGLTQVTHIAAKDVGLLGTPWQTSKQENMFAGAKVLTKNLDSFRSRSDDPFTELLLTSADKEVVKFRNVYSPKEIKNLFQNEGNLMHALAAYNVGPTLWRELPQYAVEDQLDDRKAAVRYIAKFFTARKEFPPPKGLLLAESPPRARTNN